MLTSSDNGETISLPQLGSRKSLRQEVTQALRGAIITGTMRPGEMYSAPALADRFGVSATPVREAMVDLVNEGLVDAVRNKGFRVTELSDEQLDDMAAVRMLIEVPTVADVASRYHRGWDSALAQLRVAAESIVERAETGDLIGYVEADREFHLGLLALAGNAELVAVVGQLRARSRLSGLQELADSGALARSANEHLQLLDLVAAGDSAGAAGLMRAHIGHVRGVWAGRSEPDA